MKVRMEMDKELALALIKNGLAVNTIEEVFEEPKKLVDQIQERFSHLEIDGIKLNAHGVKYPIFDATEALAKKVISEAVKDKMYKLSYSQDDIDIVIETIQSA